MSIPRISQVFDMLLDTHFSFIAQFLWVCFLLYQSQIPQLPEIVKSRGYVVGSSVVLGDVNHNVTLWMVLYPSLVKNPPQCIPLLIFMREKYCRECSLLAFLVIALCVGGKGRWLLSGPMRGSRITKQGDVQFK